MKNTALHTNAIRYKNSNN